MTKNIFKVSQVMAFIPFVAMPSTSLVLTAASITSNGGEAPKTITTDDIRAERAAHVDAYFKKHDMPLTGKGMQFVLVAEKYGLDWNLLPAIAVRESSGGRQACGNNPFGWGSCKLHNFKSYDEAIDTLGRHLGGAMTSTSKYYAGKTSAEKLYYYNGTVLPEYPDEVLSIMKDIETATM